MNENENEINSVCITDPTVLEEVNQIVKSIKTQGDLIRQLKTEKQEKVFKNKNSFKFYS